jgi:hypothetical protein
MDRPKIGDKIMVVEDYLINLPGEILNILSHHY